MSSAGSSPGTYLGSLEAGKIASTEIAPTIRNDARNARSLATGNGPYLELARQLGLAVGL
jgi:hypothetical protein